MHRKLDTLAEGGELWTGSGFTYMYVKAGDSHYYLDPEVLKNLLCDDVRLEIMRVLEHGSFNLATLFSALHILTDGGKEVPPDAG